MSSTRKTERWDVTVTISFCRKLIGKSMKRSDGVSGEILWIRSLIIYSVPQVSSVKYHTKAISTFHQINAFEEDGFLMIDLCCSDNGQAINNYLIQNLRKSGDALDEVTIK